MKHLVYVDGQEGTTGLRIHDMLAGRDDIEVLRIDPERRKDPVERGRLLNEADVAFLCLPDAAAREATAMVRNPRTRVIDASTAHRTAPEWVYGLPELVSGQRERVRTARRIANPGCHATAFILLLRPLVDAGLVDPAMAVSATSITGYSGGGRSMIERYERGDDPATAAPRPYGLALTHKHIPEMQQYANLAQPPVFMPVVADFYKGLAVSVPVSLRHLPRGTTAETLHAAFVTHYAGERFVQILPLNDAASLQAGGFDIQACNDSNRAEIAVFGSDSQALLLARLDNLGKGASGAAVQSMNLCLGCDEAAGLT